MYSGMIGFFYFNNYKGTKYYMAPEMKLDLMVKYDNRVDVYALGKVMLKIW